ncbi:hypothetical protein SESBI_19185 [Sesbania bispinosa]|nr:hypothetical protein SESBI_19185 [Sesbania bispinosa]
MRRGNIGMKHKVVTSLLLGHLFVMIALGCPSSPGVVILQGEKGIIDHVTGGNTAMFALKGQVDPTGAAHMRKLGLGGKAHDEKGASFQERETNIIVQKKKKKKSMIVPKAPLKFSNVVSVSNTSSKRSQEDSNPVAEKDAAKEIMSLIHKDYNGEAFRRRSPINHQEPTN